LIDRTTQCAGNQNLRRSLKTPIERIFPKKIDYDLVLEWQEAARITAESLPFESVYESENPKLTCFSETSHPL
jgi:hypothetical protein